MDEANNIQTIASESGLEIKKGDELNRAWLAQKINELINHDFPKLVSILYRVDVDERKLRHLLSINAGKDAAPVIADLLIERQEQKKKWRDQYNHNKLSNDDEEKW
jgi:hypothetical protein